MVTASNCQPVLNNSHCPRVLFSEHPFTLGELTVKILNH